jgi:hypothetical protein
MSKKLNKELLNTNAKENADLSIDAFVTGFDPELALKKARVVFDETFTGLVAILSVVVNGTSIVLFNECGISTIASHVKNGKTKLIWMIAQALVLGMYTTHFLSHLASGFRVAVFDSEQGRDRVQQSVNSYFGNERNQPDVFSIRELNAGEMLMSIRHYISTTPAVKVAFIDIGSDLVSGGVNDLNDSMRVLNELQSLAETHRVHICLSVHFNKGRDRDVTGHFGSILLKRSENLISVAKKKDFFVVKSLFSRDLPFEPFAFTIKDGMATPCDFIPSNAGANSRMKKSDFDRVNTHMHKRIIIACFGNHASFTPAELKAALQKHYSEGIMPIGLLLTRELLRHYVKQEFVKKVKGRFTANFDIAEFVALDAKGAG